MKDKYVIAGKTLSKLEVDQKVSDITYCSKNNEKHNRHAVICIPQKPLEQLWNSILDSQFSVNAMLLSLSIGYEYDFGNSCFGPAHFKMTLNEPGFDGVVSDLCWLTDELMSSGHNANINTIAGMAHVFILACAKELFLQNVFHEFSWCHAERTVLSLEKSCDNKILPLLHDIILYNKTVRWWLCEPAQEFTEILTAIFFFVHNRYPENWHEIYSAWLDNQGSINKYIYGYTFYDEFVEAFRHRSLHDYVAVNFDFFRRLNKHQAKHPAHRNNSSEDNTWTFMNRWSFSSIPKRHYDTYLRDYMTLSQEEQMNLKSVIHSTCPTEVVQPVSSGLKVSDSDADSGEKPDNEPLDKSK